MHDPIWPFEQAIYDDLRFKYSYSSGVPIVVPYHPLQYFVRKHRAAATTPEILKKYLQDNFKSFEQKEESFLVGTTRNSAGCVVDMINGRLVPNKRVTVSGDLLKIDGWLADPSQPQLSEQVSVVLQSRKKKELFVLSNSRRARPRDR